MLNGKWRLRIWKAGYFGTVLLSCRIKLIWSLKLWKPLSVLWLNQRLWPVIVDSKNGIQVLFTDDSHNFGYIIVYAIENALGTAYTAPVTRAYMSCGFK